MLMKSIDKATGNVVFTRKAFTIPDKVIVNTEYVYAYIDTFMCADIMNAERNAKSRYEKCQKKYSDNKDKEKEDDLYKALVDAESTLDKATKIRKAFMKAGEDGKAFIYDEDSFKDIPVEAKMVCIGAYSEYFKSEDPTKTKKKILPSLNFSGFYHAIVQYQVKYCDSNEWTDERKSEYTTLRNNLTTCFNGLMGNGGYELKSLSAFKANLYLDSVYGHKVDKVKDKKKAGTTVHLSSLEQAYVDLHVWAYHLVGGETEKSESDKKRVKITDSTI